MSSSWLLRHGRRDQAVNRGRHVRNELIPLAAATRLVFGVALCALHLSAAVAGPAEETELAEKEFARGDLVTSLALWRKAAQRGYAPAQARLGDILDKAEEDVEAVEWYRKAALQGNASAEYGLGQMYVKGEGVKKDLEQARLYVLRAAEKDYLAAVTLMMEAYRMGGLGLTADKGQADAWEARLIKLSPGYKRAPASARDQAKKVDGK